MSPRLLLLVPAMLLSVPSAHGAAPAPRSVRIVVTGTVTHPGGRPVRGARVELAGAPGAVDMADAEGRYALAHLVPDVAAAARERLRLVLRARHRGWNLALPSGAPSLAVELRLAPAAGDGGRLEVRSNDPAVAKVVAQALGSAADAVVVLEGRFVRLVGPEDGELPELTALEVTTVAAPPAAPPLAPPPAAPAASDSAAAPRVAPPLPAPGPPRAAAEPEAPAASAAGADTVSRPGFRVSLRSDTAAAEPAPAPGPAESPLRVVLGRAVPGRSAAAPEAECACRVNGTVEVRPESPVYGGPRVVITLASQPALRDTVAIFMGPPRSFDLGRVPCGRHELVVLPLSGRRLVRVEPDSTGFACEAGGVRQFRVVLEPR